MLCSLEDLRKKEVIDITTGERLGYIDDLQLDTDGRRIRGYLIYGRRLFRLIRREEDVLIPCDNVRLYGKDVLLVEM